MNKKIPNQIRNDRKKLAKLIDKKSPNLINT